MRRGTPPVSRSPNMRSEPEELGNCSRKLVKEVATVHSMDVVLPVKPDPSQESHEVRLRVVARPELAVAELLVRLGLELPNVPRLVQNVVEKNRQGALKNPGNPRFRFQD
jgi:hypothetical protein